MKVEHATTRVSSAPAGNLREGCYDARARWDSTLLRNPELLDRKREPGVTITVSTEAQTLAVARLLRGSRKVIVDMPGGGVPAPASAKLLADLAFYVKRKR